MLASHRDSLPPTYGPSATILSDGFVPDPEHLLRRRITVPAHRQQPAPTQTGFDALINVFAYLLAPPPPLQELDVDDDDDESLKDSDLSDDDSTIRALDDDDYEEGEGGEDEGYFTGIGMTPRLAEGKAVEGLIVIPTSPDDSATATVVCEVPQPAGRLFLDPPQPTPLESTPTSPCPASATPIATHRRPVTVPGTSNKTTWSLRPSRLLCNPPPSSFPLLSSSRMQSRPLKLPNFGPTLLPHLVTTPAPSLPTTEKVAESNPLSSSPVPPSASSNLSSNSPHPRQDEIPSSSNDEPLSQAPTRTSSAVSDRQDCSHDEDSEEEEPVPGWKPGRFGIESEDESYFRAPKSTEWCALKYTNDVQPYLEAYFDENYESFFMCLVVACRVEDDELIEIPEVFIGFPQWETRPPAVEELPEELLGSGLGIVLCRMDISWSWDESMSRRIPYPHITTGLAVGYELDVSTTIGALIQTPEGRFIGLTSGHLTDRDPVGKFVTQPNVKFVMSEAKQLQAQKKRAERVIERATDSTKRDVNTIELGKIERRITTLEPYLGTSSSATAQNIHVGTITGRELKSVKINGRGCIADWLLFDVMPSREPTGELWTYNTPTSGELGKVEWAAVRDWGVIEFDQKVRKNGASTGFTFGVIAGVLTSWKSPSFESLVNEYYVMEEAEVDLHQFAKSGDSGSALITNDGYVIGFVMATAAVYEIDVVLHPKTKIPDLIKMKSYRGKGGNLEFDHKVWFETFADLRVTLSTCTSVVEERAGIKGMGNLLKDS